MIIRIILPMLLIFSTCMGEETRPLVTFATSSVLAAEQPLPDDLETTAPLAPKMVCLPAIAEVGLADQQPLPDVPATTTPPALEMTCSPDSAEVGLPQSLAIPSVDEAQFVRLVLSCDDDELLQEVLITNGLTLRESINIRQLPAFITAVSCYSSLTYGVKDTAALEQIEQPAGVRIVRYVEGSNAAVSYVQAHPEKTFVIVADINQLSPAALRTLGGSNIAAIIVGHYHAADARPSDYPANAEDVMRAVKAIRLVSDAPVLLAVSATNWHTRQSEKSWPTAFGDILHSFDGWAVYNLHNWAAIMESPSNPRKVIFDRLGLPEKPCILLDFMGSDSRGKTKHLDHVRRVWQAKAPGLLKTLKDQKWRGVIVWSASVEDAKLKAEILKGD